LKTMLIKIAIFLSIFMSGCAIVTTYGKDPKKLSSNTYRFELYYNMYSSDEDIDKKADEIINEIKMKNGHSNCSYDRGDTRPMSGNQSVIYNVSCS